MGVRAFLAKQIENNVLTTGIAAAAAIIVTAALLYVSLKKDGKFISFAYAGVTGAMTNTLLVMGGIYVLYKDAYAQALTIEPTAVLGVIEGVISFNGVIEAIVAAILISGVGAVLAKVQPVYKKQVPAGTEN